MRVAILGAGPAGLFAAHAVAERWRPHIFSYGGKSRLYGAQYLHAPIPGLTKEGPERINYFLRGTVAEYRIRVYGPHRKVTVSPEVMAGHGDGWDIRSTYDVAWDMYSKYVAHCVVTPEWLKEAIQEFDLVISTVPARAICDNIYHRFISQRVWAIGDAPDLGVECPPVDTGSNTVICNGMKAPAWYRAAEIFGYRTVEWPLSTQTKHVPQKATLIRKPIATDCDCWGNKVLRLGRFGAWNKNALSHTAFYSVKEHLDEGETKGGR